MSVYTVEVLRKVVDSLISQLHDEVALLRFSVRKEKECNAITGLVATCEKAISNIDAVARSFCPEGAAISTQATSTQLQVIRLNPRFNPIRTIGLQAENVITPVRTSRATGSQIRARMASPRIPMPSMPGGERVHRTTPDDTLIRYPVSL